MSKKTILLAFIMLFTFIKANSQNIGYSYDDSGNRIYRAVILQKSTASKEAGSGQQVFKDEIGENLDISIYPNPVKSELHIAITGFEESSAAEILLYDQAGNLLAVEKNVTYEATLDFSDLIPGNYFLLIRAGSEFVRWKVVKE